MRRERVDHSLQASALVNEARAGAKTPVSSGTYAGLDLQQGAEWSRDGRVFEMTGRPWENFAVSQDGRRFPAVVPRTFAGEQPLTVITNWPSEIR